MDDIIIVGSGIGGLTLGLALHAAGIPCRIFESAAEIRPIGVGINLLPHATKELAALGLLPALAEIAIETRDATFFNRFGQLIYQEPLGRAAGYEQPQFSIHRGDLQMALLDAFRTRAGGDRIVTNHHCTGIEQDSSGVGVHFSDGPSGANRNTVRGRAVIACDGINSAIRKQLFPDEGEPRYSGVNMWRGVTRWKPMLSGASMVRAGWLSHGKMVIYPIRAAGPTACNSSTGSPKSRHRSTASATGTGRARSMISSARFRTGISIGSTCPLSSAPPTACWNSR
jgi:2-polyprenyl-6-methoxyphenol hydroxylase-like FAD-dependent oxidoreductase